MRAQRWFAGDARRLRKQPGNYKCCSTCVGNTFSARGRTACQTCATRFSAGCHFSRNA
jgi:hypothetical protein